MVVVTKLDLATLDHEDLQQYEAITPSELQVCFQNKDPHDISNVSILAIGATTDNKPVGVALASLMRAVRHATLHWVYARSRTIYHKLLDILEKNLEGISVVTLLYEGNPLLESVLESRGWESPNVQILRYYFDCFAFNPIWFQNRRPLSKRFETFPWNELTSEERKKLEIQADQRRFSSSVSPFGREQDLIEPINSLGLRCEGEVIGWMITHRIAPETIRYSALYIDSDYRFFGYAITLLCESILRQKRSPIQWSMLELNLGQIHPRWLQFAEHRLKPFTYKVTKTFRTWKNLTQPDNKATDAPPLS